VRVGRADSPHMGRSVISLCAFFGGIVGGYVPELWGSGSFSLASVLFGAVGAIVGVMVGARLADG
jgi:hypothetical protein